MNSKKAMTLNDTDVAALATHSEKGVCWQGGTMVEFVAAKGIRGGDSYGGCLATDSRKGLTGIGKMAQYQRF